ncbi:MAG: ABC transporter permease [Phycisphaerales bacterium]
MNLVAIKMLTGDRLKYLGLVLGLGFAVMLIVQQSSILVGMAKQTQSFIEETAAAGGTDIWVMDPQVYFSEDAKPLQDTALYRVRGIDGVDWAVPMYKGWLKGRLPDGTLLTVIVVGVDEATLIGAPTRVVDGRVEDLRRDRAAFIDAADGATKLLMKRDRTRRPVALNVGDSVSINDFEVIVRGTYAATPSFFWDPVIYTTYSRALKMAPPERRLMNFVLVKVKPGQSAEEVAARIESATGLEARTNDDFKSLTSGYILEKTGILVNFGLAVGLGFLIGTLIAGQLLYNFTLDNLRHFAALKAMGAGNRTLARMMFVQVGAVGVLGYGLGLGAATLLGWAIVSTGLAFRMTWHIPVFAAGALATILTLAGVLSLARVLRLEPGIVFKS